MPMSRLRIGVIGTTGHADRVAAPVIHAGAATPTRPLEVSRIIAAAMEEGTKAFFR